MEPDPDPQQNVMDPEHRNIQYNNKPRAELCVCEKEGGTGKERGSVGNRGRTGKFEGGLGKRWGWEREVGLGKRGGAGKERWGWEREVGLGKRGGAGKERWGWEREVGLGK
jgi:hypothetical protein